MCKVRGFFCEHSSAWKDISTLYPTARKLLGILVHSGGWLQKKKDCFSAAGPLWLTAERQPPTSYSACVIPAVQLGEGFIHLLDLSWCHRVTRCAGCNLSLCCNSLQWQEITAMVTNQNFSYFEISLIISPNWFSFSSQCNARGEVSSSTQTHTVNAAHFQHLHHSPNWGEAFISIHHHRPHGDLITSLVYLFIYLLTQLHAPSPESSHLVPIKGLRL